MKNRITQLKIKICSLAAEARIIHREEGRCEGTIRHLKATGKIASRLDAAARDIKLDLAEHRRKVIRPLTRHSQLAYAFLRGVEYHKVEPKVNLAYKPIDWAEVQKTVDRFGDTADTQGQQIRFEAWMQAAKPKKVAKAIAA